LTDDPREWPAVWCLLSIGIVLIALLPQVRPFLCTRTWPLWPRRLEAEPEARVPAALVRA
jgi:hypothetical protein